MGRIWGNPSGYAGLEVQLTEDITLAMRAALELQQQNRLDDAMAAYRRIVTRWPFLADAWYNLGVLQRRAMRILEALDSYQRALDCNIARPEEVRLNRSVIYGDYLRDRDAAGRELQTALRLNPVYTPALLNLANLHEDVGDRAAAIALYEKILEIQPQHLEALARFANAQALPAIDASLIERLSSALAGAADDASRASLGFALGRLLDATGQYAAAFAAYTAANRASLAASAAQNAAYDRRRQAAFVDQAMGLPASLPRASTRPAAPQPIFIVGMFRSGSTLAEQLLSCVPNVAAGGELNFLPHVIDTELTPYFDSQRSLSAPALDDMAARYRRALLAVSSEASYVTDKRPDNFLHLGLIKRLFPRAKIVHTTRNPLDNCLSIFFLHLDQRMSYALDLMDIGHYFREYRRLMAHWNSRFGADIFDLYYDDLVRNPAPTFGSLCTFLNLDWNGTLPQVGAKGAPVRTASVWQVREPLYTTSCGRAQHYHRELTPLRDYLADLL